MKLPNLKNSDDIVAKSLVAAILVVFAIVFRLLPHAPNFTPIIAVAIFAGTILPRRWALSLSLAAIVLSDMVIGFHSLVFLTWGSFVVIALASSKYMHKISPASVATFSVVASLLFFLVTNFGVWVEGRLYAPTLEGLLSSYYNAIPFFRNTLMSSLVFSALLFSVYALVGRSVFVKTTSLETS